MKTAIRLVLFVLLVSLSACTVETTGPGPDAIEPTITRGSVETDYRATLDGENEPQFVICEDETTRLTYSFTYTGDLSRWTSYLRGVTTSEEEGREEFTLNSTNIERDGNTVTVTYIIDATAAPLLTEGDIDAQAITVVPEPKRLGATQLFLEVEGFDGLEPELLSADPIPVITNCPEQLDDNTPLTITDASYQSEFTAEIDGREQSVICNDRATAFSYSFTYGGDLQNWRSYFEGDEDGINGEVNLDFSSNAVSVEGNRITVRYTLAAGSAPTLIAPELSPQGIVVTPTLEGFTRLNIDVEGIDPLTSPDIAVLSECGEAQAEDVEITESSYTAEFVTTINDESRGIICDDRSSYVDVSFNYTGDLTSFNLRAVGERNGVEQVIATYTEDQITNVGSFSGRVIFESGRAPRLVAGGEPILSTQGIVITPDIVGETTFQVQSNQEGAYVPLDFEIPVAATCPQ